jgi:hypothetical protein
MSFNANLLGDDLPAFKTANPNRIALKHAHGKRNPEKDWGLYTLQAVRVAFYVLNKHFATNDFSRANTLVIGSSISNGGAAVLRAAEQDVDCLLDGVVAAEPQLNLPDNAAVQVLRGGVAVASAARPLYDYTTYAGMFQACAARAPSVVAGSAFVITPVISSGFMTMRALEVAQDLAADNVGVAVLHCPTIKPLDEPAVLEAVRLRHRLVVVAENHSVVGGLGEAVASTLLRHRVQPAGFQLAGLPDAFLDAGALPTLHERYGISRDALAARIKGWLG